MSPRAPEPVIKASPPRRAPAAPAPVEIEASTKYTTSGSTLLDLVLGKGWAQSRVVNIVGDKSSGKTLLAIEACANFVLAYGPGNIRYVEAEAAFDADYAKLIGMPDGIELMTEIRTVQQFAADLDAFLDSRTETSPPCLYVVDSLDALSDTAEMEREIDKGNFGAAKAKFLSEMFRVRISAIAAKKCTLFIISQLRDKIGVIFGEKHQRSGGKALDFYASQVVWLAEVGKIKKTVLGAERVIGMRVKARTKKNKVGTPFREAELTIFFSYGVDDEISMLDWIKQHKCENLLALSEKETRAAVLQCRKERDREGLRDLHQDIASSVAHHWARIETLLAPTMSKYGE